MKEQARLADFYRRFAAALKDGDCPSVRVIRKKCIVRRGFTSPSMFEFLADDIRQEAALGRRKFTISGYWA